MPRVRRAIYGAGCARDPQVKSLQTLRPAKGRRAWLSGTFYQTISVTKLRAEAEKSGSFDATLSSGAAQA
jgi:hypothetical protein